MDEHEYREMKGLIKNNKNLELVIKEQNGVIEALKISNNERQRIIDGLVLDQVVKDDLLERLRRRVRCLIEAKERLLKR